MASGDVDRYWPDLKMISVNIIELNESFLTISFYGGSYTPPLVSAKLAQTSVGGRVNIFEIELSYFDIKHMFLQHWHQIVGY